MSIYRQRSDRCTIAAFQSASCVVDLRMYQTNYSIIADEDFDQYGTNLEMVISGRTVCLNIFNKVRRHDIPIEVKSNPIIALS
jgi:hypothetical protein